MFQIGDFNRYRMSAFGLEADIAAPDFDVCFAPESGHRVKRFPARPTAPHSYESRIAYTNRTLPDGAYGMDMAWSP